MSGQEDYKYLFDVDEEVRPIHGHYTGSRGRVVYRRDGKLAVVFTWDMSGIPVLYTPEQLERV